MAIDVKPLTEKESARYNALVPIYRREVNQMYADSRNMKHSEKYRQQSREKYLAILKASDAIKVTLANERRALQGEPPLSEIDQDIAQAICESLSNDPERKRRVLQAFDDPNSDLFQALNIKRSTFLGMNLTLSSGQSWGHIVNGDSSIIKAMKKADPYPPTTVSADVSLDDTESVEHDAAASKESDVVVKM